MVKTNQILSKIAIDLDIKQKLNRGETLTPEEIKILEEDKRQKPEHLSERYTLTNSEKLKDFISRIPSSEGKIITTFTASKLLGFNDKESFVNYITLKDVSPLTTFDIQEYFAAWRLKDIEKYIKTARIEQEFATVKVIMEEKIPEKKEEMAKLQEIIKKLEPEYHRLVSRPEIKQELYQHVIDKFNDIKSQFDEKKRELKRLKRIVDLSIKKVKDLSNKISLSKNAEYTQLSQNEIPDKDKDIIKALTSLKEEIEAIYWYHERVITTKNKKLKVILTHNRDEEMEHAAKALEWVRKQMPEMNKILKKELFSK